MIDVPDKGYLLKGGCTGSPPVSDITELAAAADLIVGNSASNGPFVLDTRTDAVRSFATVDAALNELTPRPILQSAWEFYDDRRWGRADILVAVLIGLPAIAVTLGWYLWFIRVRPAVINPR